MNSQEMEGRYRNEILPLCTEYAKRLSDLLSTLCDQQRISISQVEHRAKTPHSFMMKIQKKKYKDPFSEITDLCGIRLITYYEDDAVKVAELVRREFDVDDGNSQDKSVELNVDGFGYRSIHLVCKLASSRRDLGEWRRYRDTPVEIQIRSVLQHAWAAISHKLDYKNAQQAPAELRRRLFRLSALLELADDEFSGIRDEAGQISATYRKEVARGELEIPLNLDSLREYLAKQADRWVTLGIRAGMQESEVPLGTDWDLKDLADIMNRAEIATVKEMDAMLVGADDQIVRELEQVVANTESQEIYAVAPDIVAILCALRRKSKLPRSFSEEILDAVEKLIS